MVSQASELKQQHTSFHNSHLTIRIPERCLAVISPHENESYFTMDGEVLLLLLFSLNASQMFLLILN